MILLPSTAVTWPYFIFELPELVEPDDADEEAPQPSSGCLRDTAAKTIAAFFDFYHFFSSSFYCAVL